MISLGVLLVGCAPSSGPGGRASGPGAGASATQKTVVIGNRGEPSTLAQRSLVTQGSSLGIPPRFFNAGLDMLDVNEVPHPQLAEALPQFGTDTWRLFPDRRMETTYTLRPNLT